MSAMYTTAFNMKFLKGKNATQIIKKKNMHTKNSLENLKNSNSDLSDKVQSGRSTTM